MSTPSRHISIFSYHQVYIAIKTSARIPTRRFIFVFQTNGEFIHFTRLQERSDIEVKRIIAIRPIACFLTVDIHTGMAHGTVKYQGCLLTLFERRSLEVKTIPTHSHKRKATGTSGMFHGFFLTVLRNGYILSIIINTERSVNGPIVRNGHALPFGIVITYL